MPILNHNDLKKVEEYQTFVRTSPYANATQDLAWEKVKEGWVGEQVYLEENGQIIAAMSLIIRRVFAGFSLMYAPRAPDLRPARHRPGAAAAGRGKAAGPKVPCLPAAL